MVRPVKIIRDALVAEEIVTNENGTVCVVVACPSETEYKRLPDVVSYNGAYCGKVRFNQVMNRAHYQNTAKIVQAEPTFFRDYQKIREHLNAICSLIKVV